MDLQNSENYEWRASLDKTWIVLRMNGFTRVSNKTGNVFQDSIPKGY
jgi:hypothetical protein